MTRDFSKFTLSDNAQAQAAPKISTLTAHGWQPYFAQQISVEALSETPPARVTEVHRTAQYLVGDDVDGKFAKIPNATVGDWVLLNRDFPAQSVVLDRKSIIKRRAPGHDRQVQLIAANIDTAFIVTSCNQDFNVARLERYIALAFEAEITPVILLTKLDLVDNADAFLEPARAISDLVTVVALDARGAAPRELLAPWCGQGQTVAFLGSSGVGKSTLTNALAGNSAIETQAVRDADARGRHTTTKRQLHAVPGGCLVLDTPGMRELQMTDAAAGIGEVFADLQELSEACRFNDCTHDMEPGCAVLAAIDAGEIEPARVQRWRKLVAEEAFNTASLAERRVKNKAFGKMVRKVVKAKHTRRWE